MIFVEQPKFKKHKFTSLLNQIPNNRDLARNEIKNLIRTLNPPVTPNQRINLKVGAEGEYGTWSINNTSYFYTIEKVNIKRVDIGKKKVGQFGQPVTNFKVLYPAHVNIVITEIPTAKILEAHQYKDHFYVRVGV